MKTEIKDRVYAKQVHQINENVSEGNKNKTNISCYYSTYSLNAISSIYSSIQSFHFIFILLYYRIYVYFVMLLCLEKRNIKLLKLLPALCVPTMRIRNSRKNMKPMITESLNSFILSVNVSNIFISLDILCETILCMRKYCIIVVHYFVDITIRKLLL